MSQVTIKEKQQSFTFGLVCAGLFIVIVAKSTGHVPWWALVIAVFGSVIIDRITGSSPRKGMYIE